MNSSKSKRKEKRKKKKMANASSGNRTTSEETSEIHQALFTHSSPAFQWASLFDQEHSQEELEEMLTTKPHEFKRCKLKMERYDLAYAKPRDDPTSIICISGSDVGRSFPGDEVCVKILSRELQPHQGEILKGKVVGLMERSEKCCTIICRMEGNKQLVTPVKRNMTQICILQKKPDKVEIRKVNPQSDYWYTKEYVNITEDQLLVVRVLKWQKDRRYPLGVVTKVIPKKDYLNEFLKIERGIEGTPPSFQPRCEQNESEIRMDFCEYFTFTIDSPDTRDLDDAFSLSDEGENYMIAIHVTDVASYIRKDSKEDQFAKKQGRTIYNFTESGETLFMFSREASEQHLSLRWGEVRKAISLVTIVNKATKMIESSSFTLSDIRSHKRLTYGEVNKIIESLDDNEAPLDFTPEENCVAVVYCFSKVLRKFRLEGSWSSGQRKGKGRAECMVEELMCFYNNAVAEELITKDLTRDLTPLRCHFKPDPILLEQFKRRYASFLPFSSYHSQICDVSEAAFDKTSEVPFIYVLTPVFQKMKALAKKDYHKLVHLIISDEIHPTLRHMANEFKEIQKKAVILRSCSNLSSKLGHFDLQLNAYTWASSPMRRYLDLILQRLLHSVLSKKGRLDLDYTKAEIDQFCDECDCTEDLESLTFLTATKPSSSNVTKLAIVGQLSPGAHEFFISFPLDGIPQLLINYRHLKVVKQPEYKDHSCTLKWKRRVYSFTESIKPQHQAEIYKNVIPIPVKNWMKMISAVKDEDWDKVSECLQDVKDEKNIITPGKMSDENHYKEWNMELKLAEVLRVQLGTEVINQVKMSTVNLLTVDTRFEVCLEHARNPIKCFTTTDECRASKTHYWHYKEYQEIWSKLCQMDTAYNAVEENNSVILEDVNITWTGNTNTSLKGYFEITQTKTKQWSLEFNLTNCYLCIRLRDQCAEKEKEKQGAECNGSYSLSDLQNTLPFTWVAHGVPTQTGTKKKKEKKNLPIIKIHFEINHQNMTNYPPELKKKETKFTVEVIPKKIPYVQYEHAIDNIKKANNLVKSIATGTVHNTFGQPEELRPAIDHMYEQLDLNEKLNESQKMAVQNALKNPFTVIQGPPGTGKTVVGVCITQQFYKKNKVLEEYCPSQPARKEHDASSNEERPKKRGILYCGPSNKSVDIVAEHLLNHRKELKPLRIYCDQMEMREFPYPGSALKLCRRSLRDEKPKKVLRDISLMYLVRKPENPYSEEIKAFENGEEEFVTERYKTALKNAQKHELLKHDVILCTCSTALKPILTETMDFRQILIDECAMATEPEAFIPLVSHKPEQIVLLGDHKQIRPIVTCARVKDLGMDKSLFERYMHEAVMLDTQYRMHERICEFPSNEFYEGKLKTGTKKRPCLLLDNNDTPTAILFGHVEGEEVSLAVSTVAGNEYSADNQQEAEQAVQVAKLLICQSRVKPEDVVILTPYNAQMSKIKQMLEQTENQAIKDVSVFTIMKSQGSEWRYVILSTVRSCPLSEIENEPYKSKGWLGKKLGFITDPNQVNVAITRAQEGLCILGNRHLLNCSELWRRLLAHYRQKNCMLDSAKDIKVVKVKHQ
ncbi:helicase with zinc finger domain 2 isoform X2 [Hemibagrus wyckioides]|uniref:helicase with zinc finger domain 2 isoform X2 n=1 Tax=Hemibagrus wyckioides TaxID=337641 RepID=UPI00266C04EC|nr:helicase with zinc finger domain 2 isoform X2 [Hemibagrus wyckioides]